MTNDPMKTPLNVVVLTYNEALNLTDCLASVADWAESMFVVDSGSTDRTVEIAEQFGARVFQHPFETHAKQWQWALDNLPLETDWVLGLDADQSLTPELAEEIAALTERDVRNRLCKAPDGPSGQSVPDTFYCGFYCGYEIKRRQIFRGRWIRHGGYYPIYLLKLFRRDAVRLDTGDLVDHHFHVDAPVGRLRYDLLERNRNEDQISFWIAKHNRYAKLLAEEEWRCRNGDYGPLLSSKKRFWYRLPLYLRPLLYFFYRYVLRCGFLDGKQGFIFHFLQAYWFRLLVDINIDELRQTSTAPADSPGEAVKSSSADFQRPAEKVGHFRRK